MLRASSKVNGEEVNLGVVTAGKTTVSGVAGETQLLALVEATLRRESGDEPANARNALAVKLGDAALVDAAAVIGNFERMTRTVGRHNYGCRASPASQSRTPLARRA